MATHTPARSSILQSKIITFCLHPRAELLHCRRARNCITILSSSRRSPPALPVRPPSLGSRLTFCRSLPEGNQPTDTVALREAHGRHTDKMHDQRVPVVLAVLRVEPFGSLHSSQQPSIFSSSPARARTHHSQHRQSLQRRPCNIEPCEHNSRTAHGLQREDLHSRPYIPSRHSLLALTTRTA